MSEDAVTIGSYLEKARIYNESDERRGLYAGYSRKEYADLLKMTTELAKSSNKSDSKFGFEKLDFLQELIADPKNIYRIQSRIQNAEKQYEKAKEELETLKYSSARSIKNFFSGVVSAGEVYERVQLIKDKVDKAENHKKLVSEVVVDWQTIDDVEDKNRDQR